MAEAIVSVVMEQLATVIRLELEQELKLLANVTQEVRDLTATLTLIKAVLNDAEVKQVNNESLKLWLQSLKDIAYDADDVIDEWYTKIRISQVQRSNGSAFANKVRSCFINPFSCFMLVARYDIATRIKGVRERLEAAALDKDRFNLVESRGGVDRPRGVSSSVVDVSEIVGRGVDTQVIRSRLIGESSSGGVDIISVVAMGGFGKTAVTQLLFKDETVRSTFALKMWICVSEPFELDRVAKEIIEQATGKLSSVVGWEVLHHRLSDSVKGKRFLLVLDDVWTDDFSVWNPLKLSLSHGAQGSKIIVTTRNEGVAKMMGSTYIHRLRQLSDDDCWFLFRQIAFWGRSQEEIERLEEIGMEISKKCKGVPLATKTLASLMRYKLTKQDWRNVLSSDIWEFPQVDKTILPSLLLSYHALPSYLKQCFMYCATIPKDNKIKKDMLVKLWMAHGFLGIDGGEELEINGEQYFDDLAMRSFFQDFEKDKDGSIIGCKMHDLVHDFAQFLTKTECSILEKNDDGSSSDKVRHINALDIKSPTIVKAKNLRTLITRSSEEALSESFHQIMCLRTLDVSGSYIENLPSGVDKLLHLRYLDLSYTYLRELPETISKLYNLQTLKLIDCRSLYKLPEGIGDLSNLRHLEVRRTGKLSYFPRRFGRLTLLRTLCKFIVSVASGGCTIGELQNLNHLKGHIEIMGLRQVENDNEVKRAELQKKKNLRCLKLDFGYFQDQDEDGDVSIDNSKRMEGVLEGLQPHSNLEEFQIGGYPGYTFPSWMSSASLLSNLVMLELYKSKHCTHLPALGKLRSLESLFIGELESVKHIGHEFYYGVEVGTIEGISFPKLKTLKFSFMKEWTDWEFPVTNYKKFMPRLRYLSLFSCPKLISLPALGRLESLESIKSYEMSSLKCMGAEFLGISDDNDNRRSIDGGVESVKQKQIIFPSLISLSFNHMEEWEEWNSPLFKFERESMPCLRDLEIIQCRKLKTLPDLSKLNSLERLSLENLDVIKHLSTNLLGISGGGGAGNGKPSISALGMLFPRLTNLILDGLPEWNEDDSRISRDGEDSGRAIVMPCLHTLRISGCSKLRVVPHYMFSHTLRKLEIEICPQVTGMQPFLPRLLEDLELWGDVGVLSRSLPISNDNESYPNIKSVSINSSPHSALPEGLHQLTSLNHLRIFYCEFLDFELEVLLYFGNLGVLEICGCPLLVERCRENLSILSHVPKIILDGTELKQRF
ncbi:hypothetical protein ACHQM5_016743 [Ranunculus cassubicifolius]